MLHIKLKDTKIILASASPRRAEILKLVGLDFSVLPADINEDITETNPKKYVKKIALMKCKAIDKEIYTNNLIIAADTTVYFNDKIYSKPKDETDVIEFLTQLSGKTHIVYTAVAISYQKTVLCEVASSFVRFKTLSLTEILDYIKTNEPFDKAGAYGIQGYGSQFIENIKGCYFNVMGFPINVFLNMIEKINLI